MYIRVDLLKDMTEQMKLDIRRAEIRALNQVAKEAKKFAADELSRNYNLKKRDINASMKVRSAKAGDLRSEITVTGKKLPIMDFSARQNKTGVSFTIKKGGRKSFAHAFIATMRTGHRGVFTRKGKTRLPISEKFTLSIPQFFGAEGMIKKLNEFVRQRLPKLFKDEMNRAA